MRRLPPAPPAEGATPARRTIARAGLALAAPASLLMLLLLFLPSTAVVVLSFTDYEFGMDAARFVAFDNYAGLLADPRLRQSLVNTAVYVALVAPASVGLGLWLAVLLEGAGHLRSLYRSILFLPVTSTLAAMATAWGALLHPSFGLLNIAANQLGFASTRYLSDPGVALYSLAAIGVWKQAGFNVLLFVAGLANVPRELYEAAAIDGAEAGWARFRMVTWPMLGPVTMFVAVITLIRAFSEFDTVAVLTNGGPIGATTVVLFTLYEDAFRFFKIGLASAVAVAFLLFVAAVSLLQTRMLDRRVHYA